MSLHLDARQRAMLQEMGVTVWRPPDAGASAPVALRTNPAEKQLPSQALAAAQRAASPVAPPTPDERARAGVRAAAQGATPPPTPPVPATDAVDPIASSTAPLLRLRPAQTLYAGANPAQTPAGLGAGWLIVAESHHPTDPLAGDAGRLLDNMLRAMRLHHHPRVFLVSLERVPSGGPADGDIPAALAETVASLQPAMVLVLGHVAARAALGRPDPLGRLRAGPHQMAGCPAVVTYDPAFLLRAPDHKAAAWADLCRALATVRGALPARTG